MSYEKRILLPLDFSSRSEAAIDYALALADVLGSSVTLLHAEEPPSSMSGIVPGARAERDDDAHRAAVLAKMEDLAKRLRQRGFHRNDVILQTGSPAT